MSGAIDATTSFFASQSATPPPGSNTIDVQTSLFAGTPADTNPGAGAIYAPTGLFEGYTPSAVQGADLVAAVTTAVNAEATAQAVQNSMTFPTIGVTYAGYFLQVNPAGTAYQFQSPAQVLADVGAAPLASPALTGTPTASTAAQNTNTTQLATTAFVLGQASDTAPMMDGVAAAGTGTTFARTDHVHPTDTSRAPLASPALTGTPTAPTASPGTNTTQLATTAFVAAQAATTTQDIKMALPYTSITDQGAVADGQIAVVLVSMAVGSSTLTVSAVPAWGASTAYSVGSVVALNANAYVAVVAGTSSASGPAGTEAAILDGTVTWAYLGPAPSTGNVFASGDVGKSIAVVRQDVYGGFAPYNNAGSGYAAVPTITAFNSASSVNLSAVGATAPTGSPDFVPQSWPYSGTPSVIVWGTDNTTAIQNALNATGDVVIPVGNFCFAKQLTIPSDTKLRGENAKSVLVPLGVTGTESTGSNVIPAIVNPAYLSQYSQMVSGTWVDGAMNLLALFGDHDISMMDFMLDMRAAGQAMGSWTSRFFLVRHTEVRRLRMIGSPMNGFEGPNAVACDDFRVIDNDYENTTSGFTPWYGCNKLKCSGNRFKTAYNGAPSSTWGPSFTVAVEINVVGGAAADQRTTDVEVTDNLIILRGSAVAAHPSQAIWIFPDGWNSTIDRLVVSGNRIQCSGANNCGIAALGGVVGGVVEDNIIEGADGGGFSPIHVEYEGATSASYTTIASVTPTSGSSIMTVSWPSNGYTGLNLPVVPAFFWTTAGLTVGGIGLDGYYRVTSVIDANTFTIDVRQNASNSTQVAWNGGFANLVAYSVGIRVRGNTLRNCSAPGVTPSALIRANGVDVAVESNKAALPLGASPNYVALVATQSFNGFGNGVVRGNTGPSGVGSIPAAWLGNNRVLWAQYYNTPLVVDVDEAGNENILAGSMTVPDATATNQAVARGQVLAALPVAAAGTSTSTATTYTVTTPTITAPCEGMFIVRASGRAASQNVGITLTASGGTVTTVAAAPMWDIASAVGYLTAASGGSSTFSVTLTSTTADYLAAIVEVSFIPSP